MAKLFCINSRCRPFFNQPKGTPGNDSVQRILGIFQLLKIHRIYVKQYIISIYVGTTPPPRIPVTTRIIPFLVGNPKQKPSFVTVIGRGVNQKYIYRCTVVDGQ